METEVETGAGAAALELEGEACCVCGARHAQLSSPEEADAAAPPGHPPLRAMLLQLSGAKVHTRAEVVPSGRLCAACIARAVDAYGFSSALGARAATPLSDKIRALRRRLQELTQKIDVFIVVGGAGGAGGAYSEQDIIMVQRGGPAGAGGADLPAAAREPDARGDPVYQCTACPLTFHRPDEFVAHAESHGPEAAHWCWSCGERQLSAAAAALHAQQHAAPDPLHCHLCDTTYQSGAAFRAHGATCAARCPACGAACAGREALRAHARRHAGLCPECFLQCGDAARLAAHRLHHRRDAHFVCGYRACILRFHTRGNLLAHIRKCHGGAPSPPASPAPAPASPRPCPHCPRTFGSAAALKRHARTHQGKDDDAQVSRHSRFMADAEWREDPEGEGEAGRGGEYLEVETLEEADASQP